MNAQLRLRERIGLSETTFVDLVVWRLLAPVLGVAARNDDRPELQ